MLTSQVSTNHASTTTGVSSSLCSESHAEKVSVAKIIMASSPAQTSLAAKVVNTPLITVMNSPITVVKTISSSTPSHFTLVNSAVKNPTITLVNAPPITVVKNVNIEATKAMDSNQPGNTNNGNVNNGTLPVVSSEKPMQSVFLKKTNVESGLDIPQSHKILTANSFPTNNVRKKQIILACVKDWLIDNKYIYKYIAHSAHYNGCRACVLAISTIPQIPVFHHFPSLSPCILHILSGFNSLTTNNIFINQDKNTQLL